MRIRLIAVGTKMPSWVCAGYQDYERRLSAGIKLELCEIPSGKRTARTALHRLQTREAALMQAAIGKKDFVLALEVGGQMWSTRELADRMRQWRDAGHNLSLLVGGAEGMLPEVSARADALWSLSRLTLPHPMVRLVVAEQLYRSWSLLNNHPYHRE